jgi:hypothetical protein
VPETFVSDHPLNPDLFGKIVDLINARLSDNWPLRQMCEWLLNDIPFCHLRFNDGEANCAFRLLPPNARNNCGHFYYHSLGDALIGVLKGVFEMVGWERDWSGIPNGRPHPRIMIGSYWMTQGGKLEGLDNPARAMINYFGDRLMGYPWVGSDDLVRGLTSDWPYRIFDVIRERCQPWALDRDKARPVFLIGNPQIERGKYMLGQEAEFLPIHRYNCWDWTADIKQKIERKMAGRENSRAVFVWCCGMAKSWILDAFRKYPNSSHLDAGHLFDACFGEYNRAYTRRRDRSEKLWEAYEDVFQPYCRRFIPR